MQVPVALHESGWIIPTVIPMHNIPPYLAVLACDLRDGSWERDAILDRAAWATQFGVESLEMVIDLLLWHHCYPPFPPQFDDLLLSLKVAWDHVQRFEQKRPAVLRTLLDALRAGPWEEDEILQRIAWLACPDLPAPVELVDELMGEFFDDPPPPLELSSFLEFSYHRHQFATDMANAHRPAREPGPPTENHSIPKRKPKWNLPALENHETLAGFLGLYDDELSWLADVLGHEARTTSPCLRHYVYRWIPKSRSGYRLIEMPKSRLKATQQRLLRHLLDHVPVHDAAHAFRKGRNIRTFAAPHCDQEVVIRLDLKDFFPSIRASRVHALFRTFGYFHEIARLLTGLCTNVVPEDACHADCSWPERKRLQSPHLPQGAPTSPALANLCAYRLDARLAGLAQRLNARYTRYADDLAFSGGPALARSASRLHALVATIALEEGFEVNTPKTRVLRRGVRQRLAGVVVNRHPNIVRTEYDRLKAILTNCIRNGAGTQNRDNHPDFRAHLLGRIAHVSMLNLARGSRLRELFAQVQWD